jgi:hypothetical protein
MKKLILPAIGLALAAAVFAGPALAERTVMVMLQEVPMTGTPPAGMTGVNVEVKMDPADMAAMKAHLVDGSMVMVCKPTGEYVMMCHGK